LAISARASFNKKKGEAWKKGLFVHDFSGGDFDIFRFYCFSSCMHGEV
jgi:hypothetical protein